MQETIYQVSSELPKFYRRYYQKSCWSSFCPRTVWRQTQRVAERWSSFPNDL